MNPTQYNWEEIFKSKSDKELFKIYHGDSMLPSETSNYAYNELKKRGVDFNHLDKVNMKWELESLIEDERIDTRGLSRTFSSFEYLKIGIVGIVISITSACFILPKIKIDTLSSQETINGLALMGIVISATIWGFVNYRLRKKNENVRKNRIKELISKL